MTENTTLPPQASDVTLLLSAQEFAYLALLGDGPSLVGGPAGLLSESAVQVVLGSLTGRGILSAPNADGDRSSPAEFGAFVGPFMTAELGIRAQAANDHESSAFGALVGEQSAIEYRIQENGLVAVSPTTLAEVSDRTLALFALTDAGTDSGAPAYGEPQNLAVETLAQLLEALGDDGAQPPAGLPGASIAYAAAVREARGGGALTLTRATVDDTAESVSLTWINASDGSIWTSRPEGDDQLRVRQITPDDLRTQLLAALAG